MQHVREMQPSTPSTLRASFDALSADDLFRSSRVKWRLFGEGVFPAWVADMDFPVAPQITRALSGLLERSDLGYHHVPLSPRLLETLINRMADRHGWTVEPQRVVPLVNVVQGLDLSVLLHSREGEGVVVQTPIYPPFLEAVDGSRRRLVENPLVRGDTRFEIDFDRLRGDIGADTRVFLLCNPHNPTGRVFERDELMQIAELAEEHDLVVVSDEIHADLTYPGHDHIPFAMLGPEVAARTITLLSATKAFNLAGLPCAFAVFGSDRVQKPLTEWPAHVLGHCGILDDTATHIAWTEGQTWLTAVLEYLGENRRRLMDFFASRLPDVRVFSPEATYLAWLDCRALELGDPACFFREQARVALSNGRDFGPPGEGFVRLNFATSASILTEILERMATAVDNRSTA